MTVVHKILFLHIPPVLTTHRRDILYARLYVSATLTEKTASKKIAPSLSTRGLFVFGGNGRAILAQPPMFVMDTAARNSV